MVAVLSASTFALVEQFPVSDVGPHGLDLDQEGRRAFVACDGGSVVTLDTSTGSAHDGLRCQTPAPLRLPAELPRCGVRGTRGGVAASCLFTSLFCMVFH